MARLIVVTNAAGEKRVVLDSTISTGVLEADDQATQDFLEVLAEALTEVSRAEARERRRHVPPRLLQPAEG